MLTLNILLVFTKLANDALLQSEHVATNVRSVGMAVKDGHYRRNLLRPLRSRF